jgi:integrase
MSDRQDSKIRWYASNGLVNLTDLIAKRAATRAARVVLRDHKSGVELTVSRTGRKTWGARVRVDSKQHRVSLGEWPTVTFADARAELETKRKELSAGGRRAQRVVAKETVADLVEIFRKRHLSKKAATTRRDWDRMLTQRVLPGIGEKRLRDVQRRDLIEIIESTYDDITSKREGAKGIEANRLRTLLSNLFNFALDRDLVAANPATRLPFPAEEKPRDVVPTDAQLVALWGACENRNGLSDGLALAYQIAVVTTQRIGAILAAQRRELDLEAAEWTIPADDGRKSRKPRTVPLSPLAVSLWRQAIKTSGATVAADFVFPAGVSTTNVPHLQVRSQAASFGLLRKRCRGIGAMSIHDCRRAFRSRASKLAIPGDVAERLMGHIVGGKVERTYDAHDYMPEMRAAAEAWSSFLENLQDKQDVTSR